MMDKKLARLRRAKRTRLNIRESGQIRLSVHRTPRHIYAQITSAAGDRVLVTASTVEKDLREAATQHFSFEIDPARKAQSRTQGPKF